MFAVGDDDQTIYGYAGATPRWLVDFGRWFPGAALHSLEVNYRCPAPVVTAAVEPAHPQRRAGRQGDPGAAGGRAGPTDRSGRALIVRGEPRARRPAAADRVAELLEWRGRRPARWPSWPG